MHAINRLLSVLFLTLIVTPAFSAEKSTSDEQGKIEVIITGIEDKELANVEALLSIRKTPPDDLPLDSWLRRHHARAPAQIKQALQPYGFYAPQINSELKQQENGWLASYAIDKGAAVKIRRIDIQIEENKDDDNPFSKVSKKFDLKPGERLRHDRYENAKTLLQDTALRYGYLDARFINRELRVNAEEQWADIVLHFDPGPRYRLGEVQFEQDSLSPDFIQRYVPFEPGQAYDRALLVELENGLIDSNYFSNVEIALLKDQAADQMVPLKVIATPRKPQQYSVGLGYGTDTGPRLNLGFEWRRVNRKGHRAGANFTLSDVKQSLSAKYEIPIADVRKDTLSFGANVLKEDAGDGISEEREFGVTHTTSWRGWRRSLYFTLGQSISQLQNVDRTFDLVIPGVTLTRTRSDDPIYPRNSLGLSLDLHGAHRSAFSDSSFLQGRLLSRYLRPLDAKSRLILRGEVGITGVDDDSELPLSQRFFAGGDQSVRGYRYQSLGDLNANNEVIGGQYLLVTSIEVDRLIWNDWGVAAFLDAGNASSSSDIKLKKGAGLGLRWRSPVGLVRLDIARPLDDPADGKADDFRLHFGIGVEL